MQATATDSDVDAETEPFGLFLSSGSLIEKKIGMYCEALRYLNT